MLNNLMASHTDLVVRAGCIRVLEKTSKSNNVLEMLVAEGSIRTAIGSLSYLFGKSRAHDTLRIEVLKSLKFSIVRNSQTNKSATRTWMLFLLAQNWPVEVSKIARYVCACV